MAPAVGVRFALTNTAMISHTMSPVMIVAAAPVTAWADVVGIGASASIRHAANAECVPSAITRKVRASTVRPGTRPVLERVTCGVPPDVGKGRSNIRNAPEM